MSLPWIHRTRSRRNASSRCGSSRYHVGTVRPAPSSRDADTMVAAFLRSAVIGLVTLGMVPGIRGFDWLPGASGPDALPSRARASGLAPASDESGPRPEFLTIDLIAAPAAWSPRRYLSRPLPLRSSQPGPPPSLTPTPSVPRASSLGVGSAVATALPLLLALGLRWARPLRAPPAAALVQGRRFLASVCLATRAGRLLTPAGRRCSSPGDPDMNPGYGAQPAGPDWLLPRQIGGTNRRDSHSSPSSPAPERDDAGLAGWLIASLLGWYLASAWPSIRKRGRRRRSTRERPGAHSSS